MVRSWQAHWHELATFYRYTEGLRRTIYTTNLIEGFHRQLRKVTKSKSLFPTDAALTKMLFLAGQEASGSGRSVCRTGARFWASWSSILKTA